MSPLGLRGPQESDASSGVMAASVHGTARKWLCIARPSTWPEITTSSVSQRTPRPDVRLLSCSAANSYAVFPE